MKKSLLPFFKGFLGVCGVLCALWSFVLLPVDKMAMPTVELDKYLGVWYEIARIPVWFEDNTPGNLSACLDVTAQYDLMPDGTIKVTNTCYRKELKDGVEVGEPQKQKPAIGSAVIVPNSNNSKLRVAFGPSFLQPLVRFFSSRKGNYWIYALGDIVEGQYSWAVVSDSHKKNMWILSRTKTLTCEVRETIKTQIELLDLPFNKLYFPKNSSL